MSADVPNWYVWLEREADFAVPTTLPHGFHLPVTAVCEFYIGSPTHLLQHKARGGMWLLAWCLQTATL